MEKILNIIQRLRGNGKAMPTGVFVFWAGGTALLSYSLVYALRKPFTAAEFDGMQIAGMDYKIVVSMIQLIGYVCAKMLGIKFISELKPQNRLKFIVGSAALSEVSLLTICPRARAAQHLRTLLQRPVAGLYVGRDIQLFLKDAAPPTYWQASWE